MYPAQDPPDEQPGQVVRRNPLVGQIPFITKVMIIVLAAFYIIGLIPGAQSVFALVPAHTAPPKFFLWNLLTSAFYEGSIISVIVDCLILLSMGRTVEPIWGSKEFVRYFVVVILSTSAATFMVMLFLYIITRVEPFLFYPIYGFSGCIVALLVAFRQLFPEKEIPMLGGFKIRGKNLAAIYLVIAIIFAVLTGKLLNMPFTVFGAYFSWLYLRLYQKRQDGTRGDATPTFSFAAFFPEVAQPVIAGLSTACGLCCNRVTFGRFPKPGIQVPERDVEDGGTGVPVSPKPTSTSEAESERRRAKALRALDLRLGKEAKKKKNDVNVASP